MICVDTSAIVAIIEREPDEMRLKAALATEGEAVVSTASLLELQIVMANKGSILSWPDIEAMLAKLRIAPRAFDERQLSIARDAAIRFARGRHKAALNFGDCFAYALARSEGSPILAAGHEFSRTDISVA